jgi:hypothetical protein
LEWQGCNCLILFINAVKSAEVILLTDSISEMIC